MSAQPRLFTAKRKVNTAAATVRHQSPHHDQHHAQVQKKPRTRKEIVEDAYGDLS